MTDIEPFSFEWFCNLTDEELSDIAMLEATWDHSHFDGGENRPRQRDLFAALALRIKSKGEVNGS